MDELNQREKRLITISLYILESQLYSDELDSGFKKELEPIKPSEVRELMDKV